MLMSVGRQPSCHVSTVSMHTSNPDFHALSSKLIVCEPKSPDQTAPSRWRHARTHNLVVVAHVQLEETRALRCAAVRTIVRPHAVALVPDRAAGVVRGGDGLDRLRARGREAVREPELARDLRGHELALRRVQLVDPDRREEDRRGDAVPEERRWAGRQLVPGEEGRRDGLVRSRVFVSTSMRGMMRQR